MLEETSIAVKNPISVYFMGSGRLAVPTLQRLREDSSILLLGVATQPDKPSGRRRRPKATPVGEYAERTGLPIDKPDSVNTTGFPDRLRRLKPQLVVVASFGQILKKEILDLPSFGCLNVHASLLPAHRGAAPVAAAILSGDRITGVSFMRMEEGLDTGPVYDVRKLTVIPDETTGTLESRLSKLAADNIVPVITRICCQGLQPIPQNHENATYAPKIKKSAGQLDWSEKAKVIDRYIRAYDPWPRVSFYLETAGKGQRRIQIVKAHPVIIRENTEPGTICRVGKNNFTIACGQGGIEIEQLIPEGSRQMSTADFLRGHPIKEGTKIISKI